jgi:DNA-binding winged helix-turn-helix (wHTH) protein/TolB-like protein
VLEQGREGDTIDLSSEAPLRVGAATIDPASFEATFGGTKERIQPQNLKVLIALAKNRGQLVTRDELIARCWDGRAIGDDVINRAISTLRQFADRAGGFEIETVPRAGYRLVEKSSERSPRWGKLAAIGAILLAAIGAAIFGWSNLHPKTLVPTIAILPFATASSDPQEREIAAGARDAVADALTRSEFHVALANQAPQAGSVGSDFVASADVSSDGGRIIVSVNVLDAAHSIVVYTHRFEAARTSADDLITQIGAQVAGSLGWTASMLTLERSHPADPAVTASLFDGGYERALQLAPKYPDSPIVQFALAYYAVFEMLEIPPDQRAAVAIIGRRAAARVLELAPHFGGNEQLWCLYHSSGRIKECEDHLRNGMRYDPDFPWLADALANRLKNVGRMADAQKFADVSLSRDPYQIQKIALMVRMLEANGESSEAKRLFDTGVREWSAEQVLYWDRIYGIMDRGDFGALETLLQSTPPDMAQAVDAALPVVRAVIANDLSQVRQLCPVEQPTSFKRDVCMLAFARLGDVDAAVTTALGTYADRLGRTPAEQEQIWLDSPRYNDSDILMGAAAAPLRRDSRYLELARRIGALDYWRSGRIPDFCRPPQREPICSKIGGPAKT